MNIFEPLGNGKKKFFGFLGLLLLVIALPVAVLVAKHQQEIRQRAAGEQTNLFFAQGTSTSPLTTVSVTPAGTLTLELYLDAGAIPLSGFDITVGSDTNLVLSQITAGPDAAKFNVPIFANIDSSTNSLRFSRVTTDQSAVITGLLHLATISFTASATQGTGSITFPSVLITSTTSLTGLTVAHAPVSYAIANAATPTPTSGTTSTPTPQPTGTPTLSNLTVTDATNAANWSLRTNLAVGDQQYGDRNYTFTTIPPSLLGSPWIRTANLSRTATENPLVTFSVNQQATIFVSIDNRFTTLPPWLNDGTWTNTNMTIVNSETSPQTFTLYSKVFPAGTISLGPPINDSGKDMYTIIVTGIGGATPTPTNTPIPTPTPTIGPNMVGIQNMQFIPQTLHVPIGTIVTWVNQDSINHTTTSDSQTGTVTWDSGTLLPGQSFSKLFSIAGTYTYHCTIHPTMTGTIIVDAGGITPSATPTPNPTHTLLAVSVGLHGIGMGDNVNPGGTGNINPLHPTRNIRLTISDTSGNNPQQFTGQITFNSSQRLFVGTIDAGILTTGNYQVKIKSDGFLQRLIPVVSVTSQQITQLPTIALVTGDIDNNNQIDILDYNMIVNCYGAKEKTSSCAVPSNSQTPGADIADDDGNIDGIDYNLFVRELSVQPGQ